ncbi:MAG: hypothetical protein KTR28_01855 [Micavibrio sp.]|nr:hypothetical protein [Micavibrio sp.]
MANGFVSYALNLAARLGQDDPLFYLRHMKQDALVRKKRVFEEAYSEIYEDHSAFYKENNMRVASALLRVLTKLKGTKLRKNKYTPGLGHELDIVSPMIAQYRYNENFKNNISDIEKICGPVQGFFNVGIVHDCGEDYHLFKTNIIEMVLNEFKELGWKPTDDELEIIEKTGERMERSTDCRKYSIEKMNAFVDDKYDFAKILQNIKPGGVMALPMVRDEIWPSMDCLTDDDGHYFQAFGYWGQAKKQPEIHVTRHGLTPMETPFGNPIFKTCEMKYLACAMSDRVVDINKRLDTNQNCSTLVEKGDPAPVMRQYLDNKKDLWDKYRQSKPFFAQTYGDGPFENLVRDIDITRRLLARINRLYCLHSEQSMRCMFKGASLDPDLNLREYIPSIERLYKGVPAIQNPACMIMTQIAEAPELARTGKDTAVYENIMNALCSGGASNVIEGLNSLRRKYYVDFDDLNNEAVLYTTLESQQKRSESVMSI